MIMKSTVARTGRISTVNQDRVDRWTNMLRVDIDGERVLVLRRRLFRNEVYEFSVRIKSSVDMVRHW